MYRKDRVSRGGGVLIAVNDLIPSTLISSPPNLELVAIKIFLKEPFFLCTVYIPPNSIVMYTEQVILKHLTDSDEHLVIVGDFNLPDVCWSSLTGSTLVSNLFCDFVFESILTQLINCPTHIKGNTLDILLTNNDSLIRNLSATESSPLLPSDYHKICFPFSPILVLDKENILHLF